MSLHLGRAIPSAGRAGALAGLILIASMAPGAARAATIRVPEDRATQGLIRPMRLRENVSLAVLRQMSRGPFIDRGAETLREALRAGLDASVAAEELEDAA